MPEDFAEIELVREAADDSLWGHAASRSTAGAAYWPPDVQRWRIGRGVDVPFRIRVVFRRNVPWDPNEPILESPVLDDLTILFRRPGRDGLTAWIQE